MPSYFQKADHKLIYSLFVQQYFPLLCYLCVNMSAMINPLGHIICVINIDIYAAVLI